MEDVKKNSGLQFTVSLLALTHSAANWLRVSNFSQRAGKICLQLVIHGFK
jgi:hypothetical protein